MDSSASEFRATETGCNFCDSARRSLKEIQGLNLQTVVDQIKKDGKGKKYDCLIGMSGGVDSSAVLHHAVSLGLRVLAFTVDNGWNDPKADENIMRMVETLKVPFYRYTIDLSKFRELQFAFLKAGVPNAEIPTDHILLATTMEMASKYNIKWVLSGGNVATESIMPASWGYNARDLVHMEAISGGKIRGLPVCSLLKWNYYKWLKGIKTFYLLDHWYSSYNRAQTIKWLEEKYGWQNYGDKHEESVWTKWFQNFYLFEKHGIDKRKAHLSSLIASRQMTRDEALEELSKNPVYPALGFEEQVMKYPNRSHDEFPKDNYDLIAKIVKLCKF